MSMKAGYYKAEVTGVSLELMGEKNWPVMKVKFKPNQFRDGSVFVDGSFPEVDKIYFLSNELATQGPNAGRSKIEILRDELKGTYDYLSSLQPKSLEELIGKKQQIVVEINDRGYPTVKYVNKEGGMPRKAAKALPPDILEKLAAAFEGKAVESGPTNPGDFFARLNKNGK